MTLELNRSLAYSWQTFGEYCACLLYTSYAADEL